MDNRWKFNFFTCSRYPFLSFVEEGKGVKQRKSLTLFLPPVRWSVLSLFVQFFQDLAILGSPLDEAVCAAPLNYGCRGAWA